jgi:type I restriction enzyme S subunit
MEVKLGYKQSEVGLIPEDWLSPQLQQITDDNSPICYGIVQVGPFTPNGIPVLAIKNLNLDYSSNIHRASTEVERPYARSRIRPEDVVVSVKGTTGRVGIVPAHFRGNISRDLARIRPRAEIAPRFVFQMLQSELAQRRLANAAVGTTRMELSIAILKQVCIPLPSTKAEQEAIAEALSDADALVGSLEQLLAKKRHLKQGTMQELLTGKRRLLGCSGEWGVKRLRELAEIRSGGTPSTTQSRFWNGDVLWCTPTDITGLNGFKYLSDTHRKISHLGLTSSSAEIIPTNSVVMTSRATIGACAINRVPVSTNQGFKNFTPFDDVDVEFLYYLLTTHTEAFIRLCGGSTFLEIGKTQLAAFEVYAPKTKAEQAAIAAILSNIDAEITALEAQLAKTRRLKQGMMQELLTGRTRLV